MFSNLFSKIIKTDNEVKLSYNLPDEICEISENRTEDNMYYLENFLIRNGYKKILRISYLNLFFFFDIYLLYTEILLSD